MWVSSAGIEVGGVTWAKIGKNERRRETGMRREFIRNQGRKRRDVVEEEEGGLRGALIIRSFSSIEVNLMTFA